MVRQDQVGAIADEQPPLDIDAEALQLVHFGEERRRVDDDAVADQAGDAGMQDARGNQVEHELLAADVDGVAGVVAALVAADDREVRGQQIDDLALAFVAPLGAQHGDVHVTAIRAGGAFLRAGARPSAGHTSASVQLGRLAPTLKVSDSRRSAARSWQMLR